MRMYQSAYVDLTDPLVMFGPKMSTPREVSKPKEDGPKHDWSCAMPSDLESPLWPKPEENQKPAALPKAEHILTPTLLGILIHLAVQSPASIWSTPTAKAEQAVSMLKYTLSTLFKNWTYDELVAIRVQAKNSIKNDEVARMLKYAINFHVNTHGV